MGSMAEKRHDVHAVESVQKRVTRTLAQSCSVALLDSPSSYGFSEHGRQGNGVTVPSGMKQRERD